LTGNFFNALVVLSLACSFAATGCTVTRGGASTDHEAYVSGEKHYLAGNFREAKAFFSRYLEAGADSVGRPRANYWLGRCALSLKDYDEALTFLSNAIEETGENWVKGSSLAGQGIALMYLGNYSSARDAFNAALDTSPGKIRTDHVLLKLATANFRDGRWNEASAALERLFAECASSPLLDHVNELRQYVADRKFVIQVGAYALRNSAEKQKKGLVAKGQACRVRRIIRSGKPLYVVLVGSFPTYEEAAFEAQRLTAKRYVRDAVVKP
jgi:tetratricopeptide (TPR) repeat protein